MSIAAVAVAAGAGRADVIENARLQSAIERFDRGEPTGAGSAIASDGVAARRAAGVKWAGLVVVIAWLPLGRWAIS